MNRIHWCLLLAAIPIVITAQFVLAYQEASFIQFLDRPDGSGAALLRHQPNNEVSVIAWDAGLSNRRCLHQIRHGAVDQQFSIASDENGKVIAVTSPRGIVCFNADTGNVLCSLQPPQTVAGATHAFFINQGLHLVSVENKESQLRGSISILHVPSGQPVSGLPGGHVARCLVQKDRIAIQFARGTDRFGQWDLFKLDGHQSKLIHSLDFAPPEMLPGAGQVDLDVSMQTSYLHDTLRRYTPHATTIQHSPATRLRPEALQGIDRFSGKTLRSTWLGFGESVGLLSILALATSTWVLFLAKDGAANSSPFRLAIDAALTTGLLSFMCLPISAVWTLLQTATASNVISNLSVVFFQGCLPSLWLATLLAMCFVGLLSEQLDGRRQFYLWGAFILACAVPVLLPLIAAAVLLLYRRYRFAKSVPKDMMDLASYRPPDDSDWTSKSKRTKKLRFGISEVMLLTAGVAVFIAIGHLSAFLILWGSLLTGLAVLSILLTTPNLRSTTLFVSAFVMTTLCAGQRLWNSGGMVVLVFTIPMLFALAAIHHYRIQPSVLKSLATEPQRSIRQSIRTRPIR